MSSIPTPQDIARDASWLIQALDPAAAVARLVAMDREAYRAAGFLDDRMFQQPQQTQLVPWPVVEAAARLVERRDARWIFHIGHVGSTLIARLLGEIPGVLSVREPRFLRDITVATGADRKVFGIAAQALFSRTFAPDEAAVVKATSFASEIAASLVPNSGRLLFVFASAQAYIATILAGENSPRELHALETNRTQRLDARGIAFSRRSRNNADRSAKAWACEMTALEAAAEALPGAHIAWLNFDRALTALAEELDSLAQFFDLPADRECIRSIAEGPLLTRYSKALEFDYSPELRRDLIAEATRDHRVEIGEALVMLERAAQGSPLLARALARPTSEA